MLGRRVGEISSGPRPGNMSTPMVPCDTTGGNRCGEVAGAPSPSRMTVPNYGTVPGFGTRTNEIPPPQ